MFFVWLTLGLMAFFAVAFLLFALALGFIMYRVGRDLLND